MSAGRFLIDECLSPELARRLTARGLDGTSVRDRARLGRKDAKILEYAIGEDRIVVTQNAEDFRRLAGRVEIHPGIIVLSANALETSWRQLNAALDHAERNANPDVREWMVNRVIEVSGDRVEDYPLPALGEPSSG